MVTDTAIDSDVEGGTTVDSDVDTDKYLDLDSVLGSPMNPDMDLGSFSGSPADSQWFSLKSRGQLYAIFLHINSCPNFK